VAQARLTLPKLNDLLQERPYSGNGHPPPDGRSRVDSERAGHQRNPGRQRRGGPDSILGGFKKQAQAQPAGLEGLGGLLSQLGGGGLLDDVLAPKPTDVSRGNEVLGQIFGSKDVSRAVAQNAASQSGLDQGVLKKMLPMVAMLVAPPATRSSSRPRPVRWHSSRRCI
jgi:hypothetical protein